MQWSHIFWVISVGWVLLSCSPSNLSQEDNCRDCEIRHTIESEELDETREYWVSLPVGYSDSLQYPVIYVLDAEWRFDLVRFISRDLGFSGNIMPSIIVGIPHIDWEDQRGIDLTFSESRIEYDGEAVDSTWYNSSNSGGGLRFYNYLVKELIPHVNSTYSTNQHETLIGHSYGGYFGAYILSFDHPFEVFHIYDPSAWYSAGEVIGRVKNQFYKKAVRIHLTYQGEPQYHRNKVEELIQALEAKEEVDLTLTFYPNESHNSLFLDSFYKGIVVTNHE